MQGAGEQVPGRDTLPTEPWLLCTCERMSSWTACRERCKKAERQTRDTCVGTAVECLCASCQEAVQHGSDMTDVFGHAPALPKVIHTCSPQPSMC
jgi:hypothetical protein